MPFFSTANPVPTGRSPLAPRRAQKAEMSGNRHKRLHRPTGRRNAYPAPRRPL